MEKSKMINRQNETQKTKIDLADYFKNPIYPRQKQYEAIRAIVVDEKSIEFVAKQFGYKPGTIYSLLRDAKAGKIALFPAIKKGPKKKRNSPEIQDKIIEYRKMRLSTPDIQNRFTVLVKV